MRAKLGQNFLTSQNIARKIIDSADLASSDIVLEVGPGKGILTKLILEKIPQGKLVSVEKDSKLVVHLEALLLSELGSKASKLVILHEDILKFDPANYKLKAGNYKIIANLPYYITSIFLRKFLESDFQPNQMVLMVQKEVAERIIAKTGKESLLSLSVKAYGKPEIIMKVPAGHFFPKPKVDSAVIKISGISNDFFEKNKIGEKEFFVFLRKGFGQKRKLLKNNLKQFFKNEENIKIVFEKAGISFSARAEDLKLDNWKNLFLGI